MRNKPLETGPSLLAYDWVAAVVVFGHRALAQRDHPPRRAGHPGALVRALVEDESVRGLIQPPAFCLSRC